MAIIKTDIKPQTEKDRKIRFQSIFFLDVVKLVILWFITTFDQNKTKSNPKDKGAIINTKVALTPNLSINNRITSLVSFPDEKTAFTAKSPIKAKGKIKNSTGCVFNFLACSIYIVFTLIKTLN